MGNIHRFCLALFLAIGLLSSTLPASGGQALAVLIEVDWSNPSAILFSATTGFSGASDSTTFSSNGVTLANFFITAPGTGEQPIGGSPSLQPVLGGTDFTLWASGTYQGNPGLSLNLYGTSATTQIFTVGNTAFTGSAAIDMFADIGQLPGLFTTGFIFAGNASGPGTGNVIGLWQVTAVPEPATGALLAVGGVLFAIGRVRRSSRV